MSTNETIEEKEKLKEELKAVKGMVNMKTAILMLGWKNPSFYCHIKSGRLSPPVKAAGTKWFDLKEVKALKKYLDDVHSAKPLVILKNNNKKWDYEDRLINISIPYWSPFADRQKSIKPNLKYHYDRVHFGSIKEFDCTKCETTKHYYEFRYKNSKKGRSNHCKVCEDKLYKENKQKAKRNQQKNWRTNHVSKCRTLIAIQIKRDMSFATNQYQNIKTELIWDELYLQCGYTEKDLCAHLEANWEPWMNWDNHSKKTKGPRWEIDHIVPRSKLIYTNLKHPNFKKCWALSNLQPLESKVNRTKRDS